VVRWRASSFSSASSSIASQALGHALRGIELVRPAQRVADWRRKELEEGGIASWREGVLNGVAGQDEGSGQGEEDETGAVDELTRMMELSDGALAAFFSPISFVW
jgi:hypothetical protein